VFLASGPWYTTPGWWSVIVSAALGVLGGAVAWRNRRRASARRLCYFRLLFVWQLRANNIGKYDAALAEELTENVKNEIANAGLSDPWLSILQLFNRGRKDITAGDFDGGRPLVLDLGSPVGSLLTVKNSKIREQPGA
jgi:hypothetical protein